LSTGHGGPRLLHPFVDVGAEDRAAGRVGWHRHGGRAPAGGRERCAGAPLEENETAGVPDRKPSQERGVDDAEERGVGADAQAERDDRERRETGIASEPACRVAQILDNTGHQLTRYPLSLSASPECARASPFSSSTTRPSNRWIERPACLANRWSCVTMQIVAPARWSSWSRFITASPLVESRFPVGSSASRISGEP